MWDKPQESTLKTLARHIDKWQDRTPVSQEAIADDIVKAHELFDPECKSGVRFNPQSKTESDRLKANHSKIWRWLDDRSKDTNLMPVNFLQSMLVAMPADLRVSFLNEFLSPLELQVTAAEGGDHVEICMNHVIETVKESGEANHFIAKLMVNQDLPTLKHTHKEVDEAIETYKKTNRIIKAMIRAKTATGRVINRVLHPHH